MQLVIGRIARAHGINGELAVDVRTDAPDERFEIGAVLQTDPIERGPLTVQATRWHSGRLLIAFDEVLDRNDAELLRGTLLVVDSASSPAGDDDEWWDHDLIGLAAATTAGVALGTVTDVAHPPGHDLLVIRRPAGDLIYVPFVAEIVPTVDVAGGQVVVDPPEGLLEL